MTSMASNVVTVSLTVVSGDVKIWTSTPDDFYDPGRFPEHVLLHCKSNDAASKELELDSGKVLVLRVEDEPSVTLQYSIVVDAKPYRFLEINALPYEYNNRIESTEYVKHRLNAVKPIARIRGYKILPEKASANEQVVEFKPSIPAGARWI